MRVVKLAPWGMALLLWLPVVFAGGLGFAPLSFLMAVFFLFQARENHLRPYMFFLAAAFAFAAASSIWSPFQSPLVVFDLENGKYAIKATAIRVGLVALLTALIIGAALKTPPDTAKSISKWFLIVFVLQMLMLIVIGVFTVETLKLFAPLMDDSGEGYQNIGRNAVIFSVAAVLLITALRSERFGLDGVVSHIAVFVFTALCVVLEILNENVSGAAAILAALSFIYMADVFGSRFWRVLGAATAVYILTAPFWTLGLVAIIGDGKAQLPASAWWRVEIWSYTVHEVIAKKPILGWGLDAMRTFRDTFPDGRFEGLLIIPNHTHNMVLHVWAETGLIGAGLVSLTCLLFGWRLSNAQSLTADGRRAAAGLWAVVMVVCSFSFSLWNEWWWALVGIMAAIVVLFDRAVLPAHRVEEGN